MKRAFTLAEVLITLGIIGIVAAMTLPSLIGKYQKKETVAQLQKAYTVLNQAFRQAEAENESSEYWNESSNQASVIFEKYWKPYLKSPQICISFTNYCGYQKQQPWKQLRGNNDDYCVLLSSNYRLSMTLADGQFVSIISGSGYDVNDKRMIVDLNGPRKPNILGRDTFLFTRVSGKGILPYGYQENSGTVNNDCSKSGKGYMCAAKIIKENWEINNDYPW